MTFPAGSRVLVVGANPSPAVVLRTVGEKVLVEYEDSTCGKSYLDPALLIDLSDLDGDAA